MPLVPSNTCTTARSPSTSSTWTEMIWEGAQDAVEGRLLVDKPAAVLHVLQYQLLLHMQVSLLGTRHSPAAALPREAASHLPAPHAAIA